MPRPIQEITYELAAVTDGLIALDPNDFAERYELLSRQDELRAESRQHVGDIDAQRSTQDVLAELVEARSRRDAQVQSQTGRNLMSGPGGTGGAAGAVSGEMMKLSLKADDAGGLGAFVARVSALESILTARGIDIESALQNAQAPGNVVRPHIDPA